MATKGIILASFGSIYGDAVEASVGAMEKVICEHCPGATVRRVFLSEALIDKWNDKYETKVETIEEAMDACRLSGVTDLYIVPFALVSDQCYQQLRKQVLRYTHGHDRAFSRVSIGKPLLSSLGVKNYADDYAALIDSILKQLNVRVLNKAVLLMANGQNQLEYSTLQLKCMYGNAPNMAVFTSNGFPTFKQALSYLERVGHKDVVVVPLALIGSAHLMDYLGGDRPDSIYALLAKEGYRVEIWNEGLGENPYVQELFLRQLEQSIRMNERKQASYGSYASRPPERSGGDTEGRFMKRKDSFESAI